MGLVTFHVQ